LISHRCRHAESERAAARSAAATPPSIHAPPSAARRARRAPSRATQLSQISPPPFQIDARRFAALGRLIFAALPLDLLF